MIVLDCSYTMALVLPDERRPRSLRKAAAGRLFAPTLWALEVANALRNVVRRGRLPDAQVAAVCSQLDDYAIELDGGDDAGVLPRYLAARTHDLTPYDAAYLELALQRRCALATLDARLAEAAQRAGLAVLN